MEVYLDNAATSHPKPDAVLRAVQRAMTEDNGNPGRSGHRRALSGARTMIDCREALAQLLHASDPFDIMFQFNCTDALNQGLKGALHKGDHVITSLIEHNSVLRVLEGLRLRGQIELTLLEPEMDGRMDPEKFYRAAKPNTALIALTQASNVTGVIQPVRAVGDVARRLGVRYLVDGAQGLGLTPVDVARDGISLYAFPGHKGLLGPQGSGGLYIAPGYELNTLREGGTGSSSESMRQPSERPERYESGTVNLPGIAGMGAGARYVIEHEAEIHAKEAALRDQLMRGLRRIAGVEIYCDRGAPRTAVVSFNVSDHTSGAVADALDRQGYCVRGGLHCAPGTHRVLGTLTRGAVRASLGAGNTAAEVEGFLAAVSEVARSGVAGPG